MALCRSRGFGLYYEVHGAGGGVPLLLVMGMGGTCQGWMVLQVPELSRTRRNVIFDHRGAGGSEDPGGPFTTRDLAEDALGLLDAIGLERVHVLGGFLGGLVAQELAIAHPHRVQSLILAGSFARVDGKRRLLLELWKEMALRDLPRELRIKQRLAWTLHDHTLEQRDLIDALWRFYLQDDAPLADDVYARQVDACLTHDAVERLAEIRAPTLVVAGEEDILTPPKLQRQLASKIPKAELVLLQGAGHLAAAEIAPRFNRLVSRFIEQHES